MSRFVVVEFNADASDNRPLGTSGQFLIGQYTESDIAVFPSIDSGLNHGAQAANRRTDCTIEAIGQSRTLQS